MLVVISDLHLTDGTTSENVAPQAFDILKQEIVDNVRRAKAQEVQVLLLGDIFDIVRTEWWFDPAHVQPNMRPWYNIDPHTGLNTDPAAVEKQFSAVLQGVFAHAATKAFVAMLNTLPKDSNGNAPKITYVIGNHDRAINNFAALKTMIQAQLPGMNLTFANAFSAPACGVFARHGHEWDENCNAWLLLQNVLQPKKKWDKLDPEINKVMAIGEVITAELMSGLVYNIRKTGNAKLTEIIKGIDNLRPATDVFQFLRWQVQGRALTDAEKKLLTDSLVAAISGVVDSDLGKLWDRITTDIFFSGDLVDRLQLARKAIQKIGLDGLNNCLEFFTNLGNFKDAVIVHEDDFYTHAQGEFNSLPGEIQFVLYGHTHLARHDYLTGSVDSRVKMYINTGTFLPLVQRTDDGKGFAKSRQLTMAFFYADGEDKDGRAGPGPTMDLWNGIKRKEYARA